MSAKILIIHDQNEVLSQAQIAMREKYNVTTCSDIGDSISVLEAASQEQLETMTFDLIVCSVYIESQCSKLTSFDFLKWKRLHPYLAHVPTLLVSFGPSKLGRCMDNAMGQMGKAMGASGYCVMDWFDANDLVQLLQTYLPEENGSASVRHDTKSGARL